jgi:hypothetical protein
MKIALAFLAIVSSALAQSGVPVVSATTLVSRREDVKTTTADGFTQVQTIRGTGVGVDWRFFGKPAAPYEIQCFFVAKNEANKTRYVFDSVKTASQAASGKVEFRSETLMGSGKKWMDIPFTGSVNVTTKTETRDSSGNTTSSSSSTKPEAFTATLRLTDAITGSKTEGWIVRFVAGERVLRITSNQNHLETLASGIADTLDTIAKGSRKQ